MAYSLSFDEKNGIIRVVATGSINSVDEFVSRIEALLKPHHPLEGKRFLIDNRQSTVSLDNQDAVEIGEYVERRNYQSKGLRLACIFPKAGFSFFKALETVHLNRSLNYRVFEDEQVALDWLLS